MVEFFNDCLQCYQMFIQWLFTFSLNGIPVGYFILACMVFSLVAYYFVGRFLK